MITGRGATEREGYFGQDWFYQCPAPNRRHQVNFKALIYNVKSSSIKLCTCFFSFLLSWGHLTLLIRFHRGIWSSFPRAVNHSVPSFSPHQSSLLILFPQSTSLMLAPGVVHVQLMVFCPFFSLPSTAICLAQTLKGSGNVSEAPCVHSEELLYNTTSSPLQCVYKASFEYYFFSSSPPPQQTGIRVW